MTVSPVTGFYWPRAYQGLTSLIHKMEMNQSIFHVPSNSHSLGKKEKQIDSSQMSTINICKLVLRMILMLSQDAVLKSIGFAIRNRGGSSRNRL